MERRADRRPGPLNTRRGRLRSIGFALALAAATGMWLYPELTADTPQAVITEYVAGIGAGEAAQAKQWWCGADDEPTRTLASAGGNGASWRSREQRHVSTPSRFYFVIALRLSAGDGPPVRLRLDLSLRTHGWHHRCIDTAEVFPVVAGVLTAGDCVTGRDWRYKAIPCGAAEGRWTVTEVVDDVDDCAGAALETESRRGLCVTDN